MAQTRRAEDDRLLRSYAARVLLIGYEGNASSLPKGSITEELVQYGAGIVLFDRNIRSKEQVAELTNNIKTVCGEKVGLQIEERGTLNQVNLVLMAYVNKQSAGWPALWMRSCRGSRRGASSAS